MRCRGVPHCPAAVRWWVDEHCPAVAHWWVECHCLDAEGVAREAGQWAAGPLSNPATTTASVSVQAGREQMHERLECECHSFLETLSGSHLRQLVEMERVLQGGQLD